ncbi:hypothetical protein ES703_79849 [subsurface metagenome]
MGTYDILPGNQRVECWWREMRDVPYRCEVPKVRSESTYSIALREGGFANVIGCEFINISDKPISKVFDKWGFAMDKRPSGYLFKA